MTDYNTALYHLLAAANIYAPNGKVQAAMASMVAEMQKQGESPSDIGVQVIFVMTNGVRFGDWIGGDDVTHSK